MEKKFDLLYILKIAGVLFIICGLTALMLSAVNLVAKDKIAENAQARMNESIALIFGEGITTEQVEKDFQAPVNSIYKVYSADGNILGYAVYTVPVGFKGDIEMMVGVTLGGHCKSVEIISMSETPGLGTKAGEDSFLDQFHNVTEPVVGDNIIPVAGATISSRAINTAVDAAIKAVGGIGG
ncbi:MAG: FMN-binding protein [Clostridia bacterium]|nr:FMN-binding protein [Clostridia bacterium]